MKNFLLLLFLFACVADAQTVKTVTNADIKDVKVFQAGAQVTRIVKASVEEGITELNVEGLSSGIDKNSISVSGTGDAVLLSVVHQLNYLNAEKKSREQIQMEDSLESLQSELEKNTALESANNDEQGMMQSNKSVGGANVGLTMENLQKVADFYRTRMSDLKFKLIDLNRKKKKLNEKIASVQQQLNEVNAKRNQPTSTIVIAVSAKATTNISFELSYYVTGAGWSPQYDIRAKDVNSPVQLGYKANVFQKTGEDWRKVKLKLSTGNPSQSGTRPELTAWNLDFYYPVYKNTGVQNNYPAQKSYSNELSLKEVQITKSSSEGERPAMVTGTAANYTEARESGISIDFDISIPYSIPSDGKTHTVDIQSFKIPALYSYFAVPKLDKDVFLIARISGWEELNLLPGTANIYFEGSYVGESYIDPRSTKDTLDLSLGRDKKIVITREKKKDLSSTKFIGSNVVKELSYSISVRNTKKESISIAFVDQVPVTKNSDITVKVIDYSGGEYNEESGKVSWKLDVAPATNVVRTLKFSVKYPKDKTVNGL